MYSYFRYNPYIHSTYYFNYCTSSPKIFILSRYLHVLSPYKTTIVSTIYIDHDWYASRFNLSIDGGGHAQTSCVIALNTLNVVKWWTPIYHITTCKIHRTRHREGINTITRANSTFNIQHSISNIQHSTFNILLKSPLIATLLTTVRIGCVVR